MKIHFELDSSDLAKMAKNSQGLAVVLMEALNKYQAEKATKRKPGRPKKAATAAAAPDPTTGEVKRKRGRPRKVQPVADANGVTA